jgi:hypothetical protein
MVQWKVDKNCFSIFECLAAVSSSCTGGSWQMIFFFYETGGACPYWCFIKSIAKNKKFDCTKQTAKKGKKQQGQMLSCEWLTLLC